MLDILRFLIASTQGGNDVLKWHEERDKMIPRYRKAQVNHVQPPRGDRVILDSQDRINSILWLHHLRSTHNAVR